MARHTLAPLVLGLCLAASSFAAAAATTDTKINASTLDPARPVDRFIVTYRDGSVERRGGADATRSARAAAARFTMQGARSTLSADWVRKAGTGSDVLRTSRKLGVADATAFMQQLATDPAVAHVEPDAILHAVRDTRAQGVPTDPSYAARQWHYADAPGGVSLPDALDFADGSGVVVAVIDTGITAHPDLDTSLADAGYDFITDALLSGREQNGRVPGGWDPGDWTNEPIYNFACGEDAPSSWHGTHVAGTVAELTDNGVGLAGMAGRSRVLPIRVLGHCGGSTSDIADAVVWASGGHVDGVPDNAHPASVINMSLGGGGVCGPSDVLGAAIADALTRGTTVVVAAGNSGADASKFSPASCPGAIVVGATGITGKRAFYSNYGGTVSMAAPGGGVYVNDDPATDTEASPEGFVWQAINGGTTVPGDAVYGGYAGTSQATPHVAGALALMLSASRQMGRADPAPGTLRSMLLATVKPFPATPDRAVGAGILDAGAAVQAAVIGGVPLRSGGLLAAQDGVSGAGGVYYIDVPANARALTIRTSGGSGEADIAVARSAAPAADGTGSQWRASRAGITDAVVIAAPAAGRYFIRLTSPSAYRGVSVLAAYTGS
ncbi:S8 family serine peptidase [Luteibacter sp. 3190]|uniref:S8 family serine peptidase n=1 Tax=Luteibacter sp. 3190 TaxID=2817736 RepID=UPI00285927F5|nr:S8 family serine peptidase [Luteibacter sp. 3190]MDR6937999.1 serine protease [Luteibacter sp. 3190]